MSQSNTVATISLIVFAGMSLGSCDAIQYEERFPVSGEIEQIVIRIDRGDVELIAAEDLWIERKVRGWKGALELGSTIRDGVLTIEARCRGIMTCRVDTRIELPPELDVRVEVGEGTVVLSELIGDVEVEIGEGELRGDALATTSLWASVAIGDISLAVSRAAGDLAVVSANGDVFLDLPAGPWDLALSASDVTLDGLEADPEADRRVEVIAVGGAVLIQTE